MYAFALEHLKIQPGCTFLDVGSGCGLMTALGSYLTGPVCTFFVLRSQPKNGRAHGIDILPKAIELARNSVQGLIDKGAPLHNLTFELRNVFLPDKENRRWDRIHVGAACSHKKKFHLYELLKPGGILVMPIGDHMVMAQKDRYGMTKEVKLLVCCVIKIPDALGCSLRRLGVSNRRRIGSSREGNEFAGLPTRNELHSRLFCSV